MVFCDIVVPVSSEQVIITLSSGVALGCRGKASVTLIAFLSVGDSNVSTYF